MKNQKMNRKAKMYTKSLNHFRKQFKDVVELTKVYVRNGQIVAGEWIDSKGVVNLNSNNFDADFVVHIY